jgi:hypothetical protein
MPIDVEFPDGSIRKLPSRRREITSQEIGGSRQSTFVEEPQFDPDWHFHGAIGGKWFAFPRR